MKSHRFPKYLHWRPDSQFPAFRYTVPQDIRPFWTGPKIICRSLRSADPARYRQLVADYVSYCDTYFQRLRDVHLRPWCQLDAANAGKLSAEVSSTLEQALLDSEAHARRQGSVQSALEGPLFARNAQHEELLPPDALSAHQLCMDRVVADLGRQAALHDYDTAEPFLDALLPYLHIKVDREQIEYQSLRLSAMQALLQAHRKIQLRNVETLLHGSSLAPGMTSPSLSVAVPPPFQNGSTTVSGQPATVGSGPTIDALMDDWLRERGRNAHTAQCLRTLIKALAAFTRATHASELTKAGVVAFKVHLLEHGSPQTAQRKINLLGAVFKLAVSNARIEQSPFNGVSVSLPKNPSKPRISFDADDVQRIFSHPIFSARAAVSKRQAGGIAVFWLPLLACFSGARLEEIGQLKQGDFKESAGPRKIDYFVIDNAEGKSTKTKTSNRDVPLHPVLIRLGLLNYVASLPGPDARLFPDLMPGTYGTLTANFSKWFGKFLRLELGITDKRKTFHSFRHGFATNWRACELPEHVRFAIEGHAAGSVGAKYGEIPLSLLAKKMNKLVIEGFPL
ncbi:integrase [Cupriavidus metallidurans]|mgnify:CR=1 FL=1|uniref:hypothetical protein n=1 Tax=Cupriavidus TaxID=106589 RepID=UPI000A658621|nr:hypothetical protein [Cupriavidus metallidurans]MDE4917466.1 hypothetical protein [Cupriavidus metallidurans]